VPNLKHVLLVDDEASIRHVLTLVLTEQGYEVRAVGDGEEALKELGLRPYDVVVSDVKMPKVDGLALLKAALQLQPELTFLVMSAYGSKDQALEAVSLGAFDYIQKPFKPEEVVFVLKKAEERLKLVRENRRLKGPLSLSPLDSILGRSEAIVNLKKQMSRVAKVSSTVLIQGESGTGKELVAKAIHQLSLRAAMPFVTVNCGAIPEGLIESELFGHARGAFTDAKSAKRGLFSEADGGTLLLDEVGELPMSAQVKLLRFLQEGEIRPVGETKSEKSDVRVLAATLRDLTKQISKGLFREDLFFRLNVVPLKVPPLRDRRDDIEPLAMHFIEYFNRTLNRTEPVTGFTVEAQEFLTSYHWPGNVRELEHAMERAVLLSDGTLIAVDVLPEKLWTQPSAEKAGHAPEDLSLKRAIAALEEQFIRAALRKTKGNRTRAAELLELSHRALLYKLRDYGIDADEEGEKPSV
jgi:two-component system, NtrC family, response regulator AtoC